MIPSEKSGGSLFRGTSRREAAPLAFRAGVGREGTEKRTGIATQETAKAGKVFRIGEAAAGFPQTNRGRRDFQPARQFHLTHPRRFAHVAEP